MIVIMFIVVHTVVSTALWSLLC